MKYLYLWIVQFFFKGRFMKTQSLNVKPLRIVTASSQRKAEQITVLLNFTNMSIKCTDKNTNINHDVFLNVTA